MVWFLLACLAGAIAVVIWKAAPMDDPIEYLDAEDDDDDDLLHWCCNNDTTAPDDLSSLDGAE